MSKLLNLIKMIGVVFHGGAKFYGRKFGIPYLIGLLIVTVTIPVNILVGLMVLITYGVEGFVDYGKDCNKEIYYKKTEED